MLPLPLLLLLLPLLLLLLLLLLPLLLLLSPLLLLLLLLLPLLLLLHAARGLVGVLFDLVHEGHVHWVLWKHERRALVRVALLLLLQGAQHVMALCQRPVGNKLRGLHDVRLVLLELSLLQRRWHL